MIAYYIAKFWEIVTIEFLLIFTWFYYLLLWIVLFFWVWKDIRARTTNVFYIWFCQLLQLLPPPVWLLLYIIVRPWKSGYKKFLEEVDENISGLQAYMESKNITLSKIHDENPLDCHNCLKEIKNDDIICPHCLTSLRYPCRKCKREIRSSWEVCPYCGTRQKEVFQLAGKK